MKKYLYTIGLVSALSLGAAGINAAQAADFVLKGATGTGDTTALGKAGLYFKEIVEEKSDGKVEVTWYPNGQLGGEVALLNQLNDGILQFATLSTAVSSSLNPKLDVMYLPYFLPQAWDSFEQFAASEAATELLGTLSAHGIVGVGLIPYGVDSLAYNGSPVRSPTDASGIKLRSAESVNVRMTLEAMGFNAVPLPWTEAYQSIQTKVVDGLSTPPALVKQARFHEVVNNLVISGHLFGQHVFWIRQDALAGMPEDLQEVVRAAAKEASDRAWNELREAEEVTIGELDDLGLTVTRLSDEEREVFKKATVPVIRAFEMRIDDVSSDGREFMRRIYSATGQDYDALVAE